MQPFLKNHCLACHGALKREGKLDLSVYSSLAAVVKNPQVWDLVQERLEAEEMPPEKAPRQPLAHGAGPSSNGSPTCMSTKPAAMPAIPGWYWHGG